MMTSGMDASFAASSNEPGRCRSDRWAEGSPITPRRQAPGSPGTLDASGPCATSSNTTGACATKTVVAHARAERPRAITWRRPTYRMVLSMVRSPFYAGAYAFGRRESWTRSEVPVALPRMGVYGAYAPCPDSPLER
jgi:hypothetical protein